MSEASDLAAQIRGLECPDCGELDPDTLSTHEMEDILGGDDLGFVRCPDCDEVLEPTVAASLDMLDMIMERMGKG